MVLRSRPSGVGRCGQGQERIRRRGLCLSAALQHGGGMGASTQFLLRLREAAIVERCAPFADG